MTSSDSPSPDLAGRVARLESANRRLFGIVVLLLMTAFLQTFWHFLPAPGFLVAQGIFIKKGNSPPRAELSIWNDGTPAFRLNDDLGQARALFALRRDGNLSLHLTDSSFTSRLELLVSPDGTPHVALYGRDGHSRIHLWVDPEGVGRQDLPVR
jgi:hypothetical protein